MSELFTYTGESIRYCCGTPPIYACYFRNVSQRLIMVAKRDMEGPRKSTQISATEIHPTLPQLFPSLALSYPPINNTMDMPNCRDIQPSGP